MKLCIIVALLAFSSPAYAQFGGLLSKAQKAQEQKQKFDDLNITDEELRTAMTGMWERRRQLKAVGQ